MLAVAACGGTELAERIAEQAEGVDDVEIQVEDDGVSMQVETEEGAATFSSGTDLPDGFPFPVPDGFSSSGGAKVDSPEGTAYSGVLTGPESAYQDTVAFYGQFLSDQGFEVSKQEITTGGTEAVTLLGSRDDAGAIVGVGIVNGETTVTLNWGPG